MQRSYFIWIILLIAFLLRFPGIFDGLPAAYNSTEYFLAKTALGMGARQSLDPQVYIYPTLYPYFLLFLYVLIYLAGSLAGIFGSSIDFAVQFLIDPTPFYLTGRIMNVLLSVLTVYFFYRQLREMFGEITARFAALASALSFYFLFYSQFAVADTVLIFFSTLATLLMINSYLDPSDRNSILAGLFTGLAIGTKYNAGFLTLGLAMVFLINLVKRRNEKPWYHSLLLFLSLLVGFLVVNPLWLVRFSDFYSGYRLVSAQMNQAVSLYFGQNYIWEISRILRQELLIGAGFFVATIFALLRRKPVHLILLLPVLVTFLYVGSWQKKGIDYLLAVFPAWIILFSLMLKDLWDWLKQKQFPGLSLIAIIFIPSLLVNFHHTISTLHQDTREQATEWIRQHVADNKKIVYDHYTFDLGLFDVKRYTEYGAGSAQLPEAVKQEVSQYGDHPGNISNIPVQIRLDTTVTGIEDPYEAQTVQYTRKSLEQLQNEGADYLITNSWFYRPYLECDPDKFSPIMRKNIQAVRDFYREVDRRARRIKVFQPDFWHPGPVIGIYDISGTERN